MLVYFGNQSKADILLTASLYKLMFYIMSHDVLPKKKQHDIPIIWYRLDITLRFIKITRPPRATPKTPNPTAWDFLRIPLTPLPLPAPQPIFINPKPYTTQDPDPYLNSSTLPSYRVLADREDARHKVRFSHKVRGFAAIVTIRIARIMLRSSCIPMIPLCQGGGSS